MNILIVGISAKNIHKSLAPWCLKSYVDATKNEFNISVCETSVNDPILQIISRICDYHADVVAFSCYIWNIEYVKKIGNELRKISPEIKIILGGSEVSFERDRKNYPFCDAILCGEGEEIFTDLMVKIKNVDSFNEIICSDKSLDLNHLPSPYTNEYFESFSLNNLPIANQLIYFESSRGCPFSCTYCLSSAHESVKYLKLEKTKERLLLLISHGAKIIKFVDRTFNANLKHSIEILNMIRDFETDCTFHFEISADLVNDEFLDTVKKLPLGRVQFEIGIQSTNEKTLTEISRKTNTPKVLNTIKKLSQLGNIHIHTDLIAGLPYETFDVFRTSFNDALSSKPHVLQLGFLKMLHGSAIRENADKFEYKYLEFPPYEVLQNQFISFSELTVLKGVEKAVDKFYNTGMYYESVMFAVENAFDGDFFTFFKSLASFSNMIGSDPKFSLKNSYTILYKFLIEFLDEEAVGHYIKLDCLSSDPKCMLPDAIVPEREYEVEHDFKKKIGTKNLRAEHFKFDNTIRLFCYDKKNKVTNRYEVVVI